MEESKKARKKERKTKIREENKRIDQEKNEMK
jgi:hypothetical protein